MQRALSEDRPKALSEHEAVLKLVLMVRFKIDFFVSFEKINFETGHQF